jgi:hypothetical protein
MIDLGLTAVRDLYHYVIKVSCDKACETNRVKPVKPAIDNVTSSTKNLGSVVLRGGNSHGLCINHA